MNSKQVSYHVNSYYVVTEDSENYLYVKHSGLTTNVDEWIIENYKNEYYDFVINDFVDENYFYDDNGKKSLVECLNKACQLLGDTYHGN